LRPNNLTIYSNIQTCDIIAKAIQRYEPIFFPPTLSMLQPPATPNNILQSLTLNIRDGALCEQYIQQTSNETCKGSIFILQNISIYLFFFKDTLTISNEMAVVEANSVWGLLRGLETFSQLIYINQQNYVCSLDIRIYHYLMSLLLFISISIGCDQ